jgi:signal transduction histidine kinase
MTASFEEATARVRASQLARATTLAQAVTQRFAELQRDVALVDDLPWHVTNWLDIHERRREYGRILRTHSSIERIEHRNETRGRSTAVSRRELDGLGIPVEGSGTGATPMATYLRDGIDPLVDILVQPADATAARQRGYTVVTIGLRAFARQLDSLLALDEGVAFAVDADSRVVLHPNPSAMLSAERLTPGRTTADPSVDDLAWRPRGGWFRSVVAVPGMPWRIVVEQAHDVVMAPVRATLWRTAVFMALAVLASVAGAIWLSQRMTRPIRHLHTGAQSLASGNLATRIDIRTGDELEDLAAQFNRMAESLQASVNELEARVAERTQQLVLASQHKSEFLAHMSHELRTPLNSILGFTDVLREGMAGPLNDAQREYLGDIHTSGLHLLDLIQDVLDIARIEAGRLALDVAPMAVDELLQAALAKTRGQAIGKKQAMQLERAAGTPEVVHADARRVQRVLINLLGNAVKFTPEGGRVVLRAGASQVLPGGLRIEVQDNGIGIAAEDLARIWDPFGQADAQRRGAAEGAGLGLALVKMLVELHGGRVEVASEPGKGSSFAVELPAAPPAANERENLS